MTAELIDAAGVQHQPAGSDARIVCLVPSITELLCDLGLSEQVVGRTGFCIHPREIVRSITKVGGTKDVKVDRIRDLRPTHVVVNVDENRIETVRELAEFVPSVIVTHPVGPLDNLELYRLLGGIFGREPDAKRLATAFQVELDRLLATERPRRNVLYLIWRDPWMTISPDTYISRTVALANWHTVPKSTPDRYPVIDLAEFRGSVDCVLLASEPFRFRAKHIPEVAALVPSSTVRLIDGEMTSWYGSRAIQGLSYLDKLTSEDETT
jgi:ABC-type Fe3+-hydroxamate transport system substrate-binding protein